MTAATWPDILPRAGNQRYRQCPSVAPWFVIHAVNEATFAILEPYHEEEVISYLVLGTRRAVLIDTGMGIGNLRQEVTALTDLPVVVVNTHCHFDHVGDNHRFAEVWAFDDDQEVAHIGQGYDQAVCAWYMSPGSLIHAPRGFIPGEYVIQPSEVTRRLQHLDTIDLGGRTLQVHHTPGHSPGSICLLDQLHGLLFTGDTIYPGTLFAHLRLSDFKKYLKTVGYMENLKHQVKQLCPAHNEAYMPVEMLSRVRQAFERIESGEAPFEHQGRTRLYRFDGFGVKTLHSV